jgi:heme-degrading monooxygenase HmoA
LRTWRRNPEHIAAQKLAREKYYTEYHVQVCTLDRESHFKAQETEMRAVPNQTEAAK